MMVALHTLKYCFILISITLSMLCLVLILNQPIPYSERYIFNHTELHNRTQENTSAEHLNITSPSFNNITLSDEVVKKVFSRWRTTRPRDNILTVTFYGRLGNNMFEYASLLGIAARTRKQPLVPNSNPLSKLFNISFIGDVSNKSWTHLTERQYGTFDCKLFTLPGGNVEISRYLQSWKYFHSIRSSIRKEFIFTQKYIDLSSQCFQKHTIQYKNRTVIGIHVRRTDMASGGTRGYLAAPLSYIQKAIAHMKTKFHNPVFLIATDDKIWCRANVVSTDIILMDNTDPFLDFATLTLCDHMIMTVGTFGWWAAWLAGGYAVYYKDFPRSGSELARGIKNEDHFLPHWVPIGA
ncbi:galactoside 2-alpha-L-fucosyltransferase SEC1-like [Haliotis rufescens]|uniref:galactoside 2-alpha-L-fucosyltransferase SEC1-like n=1 Tax=Haliotis rufescens TaxID=6454 RepID=UPI00201EA61B|nr:galactoside 2-alpha-L-fucosyltransferase SEC1-like [Haliotis rufescens]